MMKVVRPFMTSTSARLILSGILNPQAAGVQAAYESCGMTLVEIMITLVISSIVAASTFMFLAGQQRIY